jgi:hypothetical protein
MTHHMISRNRQVPAAYRFERQSSESSGERHHRMFIKKHAIDHRHILGFIYRVLGLSIALSTAAYAAYQYHQRPTPEKQNGG